MQQTTGQSFISDSGPAPFDEAPSPRLEEGLGRVIGASPEIRRIYPLCKRLAESNLPVVISGETGTGKELLAESLHELSPRASRPFVVLDCTAIPKNLVESALFGHEKGAFTGATQARRGVFEEAHGGTLLLDEIGDLEFDLQAKLLRALERNEIKRVGSTRRVHVDVRIMAATRRDLAEMVREGRFRDDLYFRLAVTQVELPPLRQRTGDVRRLASTFWQRLQPNTPMPDTLLPRLEARSWPGNVRELQNTVARCAALGELAWTRGTGAQEHLAHAPAPAPARAPAAAAPEAGLEANMRDCFEEILGRGLPLPEARKELVRQFERSYVERALSESSGCVSKAAEASGVGPRYFRMIRARSRKSS